MVIHKVFFIAFRVNMKKSSVKLYLRRIVDKYTHVQIYVGFFISDKMHNDLSISGTVEGKRERKLKQREFKKQLCTKKNTNILETGKRQKFKGKRERETENDSDAQ